MNSDRFKFRAWRHDFKKMVYDFLITALGTIVCEGAPNLGYEGARETGLTIMQASPFHDKEGKLIYEGDILQCLDFVDEEPMWMGIMKYGRASCGCDNGTYGWYVEGGTIFFNEENYDDPAIIIGNIYENPDLIPKEDKP